MHKLIYIFFLLPIFTHAQNVVLKTDKTSILIGEPLVLTFEISKGNKDLKKFRIDSIAHFETIKDSSWTSVVNNQSNIIRQVTITSFDEGDWLIPPIKIGTTATNALLVKVRYSNNFNPSQPYHDIKDIEDTPVRPVTIQWVYYLIVVLFFIIITYVIYKWKQISQQSESKNNTNTPSINHYQYTLDEIEKLSILKKSPSIYTNKIVNIFRSFVFHETGIQSLQQTTNDLATQLNIFFNDDNEYKKLKNCLKKTDWVKFAKLDIQPQELENIQQTIINAVNIIHQNKNKIKE